MSLLGLAILTYMTVSPDGLAILPRGAVWRIATTTDTLPSVVELAARQLGVFVEEHLS